jgi:hypothetical protein
MVLYCQYYSASKNDYETEMRGKQSREEKRLILKLNVRERPGK